MREPVDHVLRPQLPWRVGDAALTECGYDATKVKTITREELAARGKDLGQQRTALLTCMTCLQTAQRWQTWAGDPREAVQREITWEAGGRWSQGEVRRRLYFELQALAALAEAHREEFDAQVRQAEGVAMWQDTKAHTQQKKQKRQF